MVQPFPELSLDARIEAIYSMLLRLEDRLRALEEQTLPISRYNRTEVVNKARAAGVHVL